MSRKIKFRAWVSEFSNDNQVMIENFCFLNEENHFMAEDLTNDRPCVGEIHAIMQFTGLEDAYINGAEVYESDIIENCDTKALQVVYWNEDEAAWYCRYVGDENRIVSLSDSLGNLNKVVGNIYENPELLTSERCK